MEYSYSSSVWDPIGYNQRTKEIESVQGKAAQWITNNLDYDVSSGQIAIELQLQRLLERRELARLKLCTVYIEEKSFWQKFHTRKNTIHGIRLKPIYGRVNCYNNFFIPYTGKQWNLLSRELVNIECNYHFTDSLTKHLSLQK